MIYPFLSSNIHDSGMEKVLVMSDSDNVCIVFFRVMAKVFNRSFEKVDAEAASIEAYEPEDEL
jgi:tRNA(His) 5'-end guanylyltransferase